MVIQRIQSVYLLIVTILMAVYSFLDVAFVQSGAEISRLSLFQASAISFTLSALVTVLSFVTIFKYKQLNLQIALCSIGILLLVTQIIVLIMELVAQEFVTLDFTICNCMPIVSIVFLVLSIMAIKRDKKILSSYDRIR